MRKNWWWFVDGLTGDRDNVAYNWIFSTKLKLAMLKSPVFDARAQRLSTASSEGR